MHIARQDGHDHCSFSPRQEKTGEKPRHQASGNFSISQNITVVAEDEEAQAIGAKPLSQVKLSDVQFMISMGGDGSILQLVHKYRDCNAAILGINLGHLGFMADVPVSDIYPSLQDLINGAYSVEERLALEGTTVQGKGSFAVNDFVVHRNKNPSLVELAIHVDGLYVNTFEADGLDHCDAKWFDSLFTCCRRAYLKPQSTSPCHHPDMPPHNFEPPSCPYDRSGNPNPVLEQL